MSPFLATTFPEKAVEDFIAEGESEFKERVKGPIHDGEMEYTAFGILIATGQYAVSKFYEDVFNHRAAQLRETKNGKIYIRDERFG